MKKGGILNAQLLCELTKLRHTDKLVICDAGYPLPAGANVIDLSLVAGLPTLPQVLKPVLDELIFESYTIFASMPVKNPEYFELIEKTFRPEQTRHMVDFAGFREAAADAKLFIRTGDFKSCSNILLVSASGVPHVCAQYEVTMA